MYQTTGGDTLSVALPLEEGDLPGGASIVWHAHGERSDDNVALLLHDLADSPQTDR